MSAINLTHHFLIAMPNMADPYFSKTLTYICEHNDQGALGLVVNRPIDMTLQALFERLSLSISDSAASEALIYFGGPVQTDRGFVLHEPAGNWQSTLRVGEATRLEAVRREHRGLRQDELAQRFDRRVVCQRIAATAREHRIDHERHRAVLRDHFAHRTNVLRGTEHARFEGGDRNVVEQTMRLCGDQRRFDRHHALDTVRVLHGDRSDDRKRMTAERGDGEEIGL